MDTAIHSSDEWYLIEGINPEPWTAPNMATGRKNGKVFPIAYKDPGVSAYQEAIKEALFADYPEAELVTEEVELEFYFWRQRSDYRSDRKLVRKNQVDATNMQKSLEDALQGILLDNDRNVVSIHSYIVEQEHDTQPAILIRRRKAEDEHWKQFAIDRRRSILVDQAASRHPSSYGSDSESESGHPFDVKSYF